MTTTESVQPISAETSRRLSEELGEPAFAAEGRRRAWESFESFPMPSREDEAWRRTDVSTLDFSKFGLGSARPASAARPPAPFAALAEGDDALVLAEDGAVYRRVPPELEKKGVIFTDLRAAVRDHKALLEKRLFEGVPARRGKFESLNGALWDRGVFLYVPKGVDVGVILRGGCAFTPADGRALFPRTVVVAEAGSRVTYFDEYAAPALAAGERVLCSAAVEAFLEPDAELTYVNVQRWGAGTWHFLTQNAVLQRNAKLTTLAVALGGQLSKVNLGAELVGPGATSLLYGLIFGDGAQHFTHHTANHHRAANTNSDLLVKAALKDKARSVYTGMIHIAKEAQKTSSYQANRNLLLSPLAKANTIPMLEILADDVKCGHGATVGSLDDDQRFYLMSRGLSRQDAEHAIVEGFFEDVLQRVPGEATREKLREAVNVKLGPS